MYEITRKLEFDAGHRVPLHESKCKTPHGHRYVVEVTVTAPRLTEEGFVIDFGKVKSIVGGWIDDNLDHTMIYQKGDILMEAMRDECYVQDGDGTLREWYVLPYPPTAENLARHLFGKANELLNFAGMFVKRIRVWETPNCFADWSGGPK